MTDENIQDGNALLALLEEADIDVSTFSYEPSLPSVPYSALNGAIQGQA